MERRSWIPTTYSRTTVRDRLSYLHETYAAGKQGVDGPPLTRLEIRIRETGVGSVFLLTGKDVPARALYPEKDCEEVPVVAVRKGL